jgi:CMP-N-acetylneuraminic acid synthetase
MKILAIILARKGSKRIVNKNIAKIGKKYINRSVEKFLNNFILP